KKASTNLMKYIKNLPEMEYLDKDDIIEFNKSTTKRHGGNFNPPANLLSETALDYLVEVVEHGLLFEEPMYPSLYGKAALYMYNICQNHVFSDGNKRTALVAMDVFMRLNGLQLKKDLTPFIIGAETALANIKHCTR